MEDLKTQEINKLQNADLSASARSAFNSLKDTIQDQSLTPIQECTNIQKVITGLSAEDKAALDIPQMLGNKGFAKLGQMYGNHMEGAMKSA